MEKNKNVEWIQTPKRSGRSEDNEKDRNKTQRGSSCIQTYTNILEEITNKKTR